MDIPKLRLLSQQLANPLFHSPKELVSWMGAVQAPVSYTHLDVYKRQAVRLRRIPGII